MYVDTCADNHLWNHTTSLQSINPAVEVMARGFTGHEKEIDAVGDHPTLGRVYVAYWATTSLISVPRLIDMGCKMTCEGIQCKIWDRQGQLLLIATRDNTGLYSCRVTDIRVIGEQPSPVTKQGILAEIGSSLSCYMVKTTVRVDIGSSLQRACTSSEYGCAIGLGLLRYQSDPRNARVEILLDNVSEPNPKSVCVHSHTHLSISRHPSTRTCVSTEHPTRRLPCANHIANTGVRTIICVNICRR